MLDYKKPLNAYPASTVFWLVTNAYFVTQDIVDHKLSIVTFSPKEHPPAAKGALDLLMVAVHKRERQVPFSAATLRTCLEENKQWFDHRVPLSLEAAARFQGYFEHPEAFDDWPEMQELNGMRAAFEFLWDNKLLKPSTPYLLKKGSAWYIRFTTKKKIVQGAYLDAGFGDVDKLGLLLDYEPGSHFTYKGVQGSTDNIRRYKETAPPSWLCSTAPKVAFVQGPDCFLKNKRGVYTNKLQLSPLTDTDIEKIDKAPATKRRPILEEIIARPWPLEAFPRPWNKKQELPSCMH